MNMMSADSSAVRISGPNCFTLALSHTFIPELKDGIEVSKNGYHCDAIIVGNAITDQIALDLYGSTPALTGNKMTWAFLNRFVGRNSRKQRFFIRRYLRDEFYINIHTGNPHLRKSKVLHGVYSLEGSPERIMSGTHKRQHNEIEYSRNELVALKEGDTIGVLFSNATRCIISCKDGKIHILTPEDADMVQRFKDLVESEKWWGRVPAILKDLPSMNRELMEDFHENCKDVEIREHVFGEFVDAAMEHLKKLSRFEKRDVYIMHLLIKAADAIGVLIDVSEELRRLSINLPFDIANKLPPALKKSERSHNPERLTQQTRRNALRQARIQAQPKKGPAGGTSNRK